MDDLTTPLKNLGNAIMTELIANMHRKGRVASGKTINDITLHVEPTRMYIIGPSYLIQLEKGRKPTGAGGPVDRQKYGGLSFAESLKLWIQAKGIEPNAFYPIYRNINKFGFPGTPGLLTQPLSNEAIDKAMNENLGPIADLYAKQVLAELFK